MRSVKHGGLVSTRRRGKEPLVFSRVEQQAIVIEALGIFPNVWQVYKCLGKRIGVSYGSIRNIAKVEGIELIHRVIVCARCSKAAANGSGRFLGLDDGRIIIAGAGAVEP